MTAERSPMPVPWPALIPEDGMTEWNEIARLNRSEFAHAGVFAVNVIGAPASGRTELLRATARALPTGHAGVLLAGPAVFGDATGLVRAGVPAEAIPSGRLSHLDAAAVEGALDEFAWRYLDYLFVENVGGLVSPAFHDLGETARVVTVAVTDGAALPLKYPDAFRSADLAVLTKADLLPFLPAGTVDAFAASLACVMRRPAFVVTSAAGRPGIGPWIAWLERTRQTHRRSTGERVVDEARLPAPAPAFA